MSPQFILAPRTQTGGPTRAARFRFRHSLTINADLISTLPEPRKLTTEGHAMRGMPILAAFLALGIFNGAVKNSAIAADKGKPEAKLEHLLSPATSATTCYVETSVTGVFLRSTREAQAGGGLGCEAKLFNLLIAGGLRADASDWRNTASINARIGVFLNNGANAYVWASWNVPEFKIKQAGEAMVGAGAELKLDIINPHLRAFLESGVAASKFGTAGQKDAIETRLGFRYAF